MTEPNDQAPQTEASPDALAVEGDRPDLAEELGAGEQHLPPHPPFARSSDEYTDPPGHHRRGPHGPALDVGG
jgi:hypothetical protein